MSSRWQRISSLLLRIVVSVRSRVLALVDTFLARLLHWWQLQLLVVEIVRFFASVSLAMTGEFLVQLNATLRTFLLAGAQGSSFRRHTDIVRLVLILGARLLASRNHMTAHVETGVVGARVGPIRFTLNVMYYVPLIDHLFLAVNRGGWAFDWLLHATTIQALVEDLALVSEVAGAGLVGLGRMASRAILAAHFLRLLQPLDGLLGHGGRMMNNVTTGIRLLSLKLLVRGWR